MGKKITMVLFLGLGMLTVCLILQLGSLLGKISNELREPVLDRSRVKGRIAFIYQNNNPVRWSMIKEGALTASKEEPVYIEFMEEVQGRELEVDDYLRLVIAAGYDGIIIQGDREGIMPLIREARAAGIPALMIISDLPDSARLGYVGSNHYRAGFMAGKRLVAAVAGSSRPRLAILSPLTGTDRQMSVAESLKVFSFREAISRREPIVPLWEKANPTVIDSLIIIRNLLQQYPDLRGIYATYPEGTLAAAMVVSERGRGGAIRIVGTGDLPGIRAYIRDGVIEASLVEYPYQIGYLAVKEMTRYFKEGRMNISNTIEMIILDRNNLSEAWEQASR